MPPFAVIVSEKGGAERREVFDRAELTVGRVQGNDLMLPKGNVSKRHARIIYRDGRFIVTDLNSTNGTYVNRRRIAQATIVREGDRIYLGDFVIRLEAGEGAEPGEAGDGDRARPNSAPATSGSPVESESSREPTPGMKRESGPREAADVAIPSEARQSDRVGRAPVRSSVPAATPDILESSPFATARASYPDGEMPGSEAQLYHSIVDAESEPRRQAVARLVERVLAAAGVAPDALRAGVDAGKVEVLTRALDEQLVTGTDVVLSNSNLDEVRRVVLDELTGTGQLGRLLAEPDVLQVVVRGYRKIVVARSTGLEAVLAFSSAGAFERCAERLLARAEEEATEGALREGALSGGIRFSRFVPPGARDGGLLVLQRVRPVRRSLDDLVRAGVVSRAMATFLHHCLSDRVNLLLVGSGEAGLGALVSAVLSNTVDGPVLAAVDFFQRDPVGERATTVPVPRTTGEAAALAAFAARLPAPRLLIQLDGESATAAAVQSVHAGRDGLVALALGGSARRTLQRLVALIARGAPSGSLSYARQVLGGSIDIVVEVARLADGRHRVVRIAELCVTDDTTELQDVFTFHVERTAAAGAVEGTFAATGHVPRVVREMAARGVLVDTAVFSRPPSR